MDDAKLNKRNPSSTVDIEIFKKKSGKRQPHSDLTNNEKRKTTKTNLENGNSKPVEKSSSEKHKAKKTSRKTSEVRRACDSDIERTPLENNDLLNDTARKKYQNKDSEALESQCEDKNIDPAHPSENQGTPDKSHRRRGRPRKNSISSNEGCEDDQGLSQTNVKKRRKVNAMSKNDGNDSCTIKVMSMT